MDVDVMEKSNKMMQSIQALICFHLQFKNGTVEYDFNFFVSRQNIVFYIILQCSASVMHSYSHY